MQKLSNKALSLWGKKRTDADQNELWLPLIAHMIDTKNVINWLYNHWLNEGQKQILLENFSDESELQRVVKFLGFIHDIGKATPAFQIKKSFTRDDDLDNALIENLVKTGFDGLNSVDLESIRKSPHAMAGEAILEKRGLNETLGAIIGGHHGKPQSKYWNYESQLYRYDDNYFQVIDPESVEEQKIQQNWEDVRSELINYGLVSCNLTNLENLPNVEQPQAVILNGLVIMADWLASSESIIKENKTLPLFPLIEIDETFYDIGDMEERFEAAITNWIGNDEWSPELIFNSENIYQKRWSFDPRPVQAQMSESIEKSIDPGMMIIEAPMGIGKTEIALTAFEQLAAKTGRNGLFFGLPTQATANAMFSRVNSWLNSIADDQHLTLPIKLMHGKAQFNTEYQNITQTKDIYDTDSDGAVIVNNWFSGKKSILSDFVIGTIDHLLLMGLRQKHLALRHLGLSGKIVIIDEVHAYDVYMSSYLNKALEWLGAYHVPVVALSATLPIEKRNQLLKAYNKGKYGVEAFSAADDWQSKKSYPLLSILDGQKLVQVDKFNSNFSSSTKVQVKRLDVDNEGLIAKATQEIKEGGVAGIIVNTVKRAQDLANIAIDNVSDDTQILILHSRFLATDRERKEEKLQNLIGKNGQRPNKLLVIGTQVLEQSLDIDFDIMFTDIAPMDLILQRAGRLHRHNIDRPLNLLVPKLFVLGINQYGDYGDANESIYEKYLLIKTDYFLPDTLSLPDDISRLVQQVYSSDTDKQVTDITYAKEIFDLHQDKEKEKAKNYQIDVPSNESIRGWLDVSLDITDNDAQAAVRDTDETIEVILLKRTDSGDYLLDGESTSDLLDKERTIAKHIIRLPHSLTWDIDKSIRKLETLTRKNFPDWDNSVWLHDSIVLPLDENCEAEFNGYRISYSQTLGLLYEK